eukprot:TRINITY_DN22993_c0_g2_i1.p1 TRINITY_DN22993_c0_g2~~TRINITY_DN22993_c0_g2_i1.p1  ORF type:complete len:292 (+),score=29.04 TRINITY_DN22993_c0_g2_i1:39-914(+)
MPKEDAGMQEDIEHQCDDDRCDVHDGVAAAAETDSCAPAPTPEDLEYERRHAELVRRGLRYVDSPGGIRPLDDRGNDVPPVRHAVPVVVIGISGLSSKIRYHGCPDGVWVPSSCLVTTRPAVFIRARAPQTVKPREPKEPKEPKEPREPRKNFREDATEVDPALLPEDAPEDHVAHVRVRTNLTHQNPLVSFKYNGIPFQTTMAAAGSRRAAEVIARACWMKFELGATKEEVLSFRAACYARCNPEASKKPRLEQPCSEDADSHRAHDDNEPDGDAGAVAASVNSNPALAR